MNNKIIENHKVSDCSGKITDMTLNLESKYKQLKDIIIKEWDLREEDIITVQQLQQLIMYEKYFSNTKGINDLLNDNIVYLKDKEIYKDTLLKDYKKGTLTLYNKTTKSIENIKIDDIHNETIEQLKRYIAKKNHQTIVMIQHTRKTRKGNIIATLEDNTGTYTTFIKKDDINPQLYNSLVNDEVITLKNQVTNKPIRGSQKINDRIYSYDIHEPSIIPQNKKLDNDTTIVFMSDIHTGSRNFKEDKLTHTIDWINNNKVDAILIAGDIVDGVGIYPHQYDDLEIIDIYEQYNRLSKHLQRIETTPIYITPGNHDATRLAEPQPKITRKYTKSLYEQDNIHMLSNPATVEVGETRIRMYHGKAFDDLIKSINHLSYTKPCEVMKQQLEKRHLSPLYGETTPNAFDHKDNLVIQDIPDILHTGHVHVSQYTQYKGVHLVNSGCYQKQTSFQKAHGLRPNVGLIPIMKNGEIKLKQF